MTTPSTFVRRARWLLLAVLVALPAALLIPALEPPAQAQPAGKGPKGQKGRERVAMLRQRLFQKKLGLDDAKASKVEAILRDHVTKQREAKQRMRAASRTVRRLLREDSDDQQAYRAALAELTSAQTALEKLRSEHMAELDAVLTPKQQAQLIESLHKIRRHLARAKQGSRKPRRPRRPRIPRGPGPRR